MFETNYQEFYHFKRNEKKNGNSLNKFKLGGCHFCVHNHLIHSEWFNTGHLGSLNIVFGHILQHFADVIKCPIVILKNIQWTRPDHVFQ